ncbi:quinone oxidoreductase family protein [Pseudomonas sp. PDM09]|uniref:quinone oxidoreductase family protein n=1 Tax=Pseudomonas sp. PDM09 TaxID=2769270 RepID=UPI00178519A3|nr:quinone oxidoreductase [Pseudomonas sp. PDM09]MBD9561757.1 quinone oxidoreductase [Pseudomonas sp. PDM09]
MVSVVRIAHTGAPEVMTIEQVSAREPGPGEVWLEQEAIGVNFLDVSQRKGAVPLPLPSGLGLEGAGRVAAIGAGVNNVKVGDRVAYATGPVGAYASARLFPAERLVPIPDALTAEEAAAVLFKGITAQYLLKTTYPVGPGTILVLYGVAGGLGQIMATWAKHLGAFVIGIVSRAESVETAKALGCDAVLVFNAQTLAADVAQITHGKKADVVYDPIGRVSFEASLDCLRPRGLMVSFGASSGAPTAVEVGTLNAKGSLFLTRPSLAAHTTDIAEYRQRAEDVLAAVEAGIIKPGIWGRYALADVAKAHADLEGGQSRGAIVLKP